MRPLSNVTSCQSVPQTAASLFSQSIILLPIIIQLQRHFYFKFQVESKTFKCESSWKQILGAQVCRVLSAAWGVGLSQMLACNKQNINSGNFSKHFMGAWSFPLSGCKNNIFSHISFLSDPSPIIDWECLSLTHSLTHSCLVNLIDVTLACKNANSKLVEVVTVADVSDEYRVGNSLLQIWKLRFGDKA